jgi:cytochrome c biogenesis protein CcmG, thiol:disulfide interchange protein DsbE
MIAAARLRAATHDRRRHQNMTARCGRSRRWLVASVALVLLLVAALLAYGLTTPSGKKRADVGLIRDHERPAPGFALPVLADGSLPPALRPRVGPSLREGQISLSALRGTPIVLNIWASWCYPCRQEAPRLERAWRAFGPRGALFLGLNIQDQPGDARQFLDRFSITYPAIRDAGVEVARSFGAPGIPDTYFINAAGRLVAHVIGPVSSDQLRAGVKATLRSGRNSEGQRGSS